MTSHVEFTSEEDSVLVEVDPVTVHARTGEQDAGLGRWAKEHAGEAVALAQNAFEDAVRRAVRFNAPAFVAAAEALDKPPTEMEITFGLKATGEAANLAVGKVAGECNYQVKMVWKRASSQNHL
jgi:Trypsin-co-occurring domain 1